ncbi:hypothetical protein V8D89_002837 [Ganoderma adspersum]
MPPLPTRQYQKRRVHWEPAQRGSKCTLSPSSPDSDANSSNLCSPSKPSKHANVAVESHFTKPAQARASTQVGGSIIMMAVPLPVIPAPHPVLAHFIFNWDVRTAQFPNSLPRDARGELAFPGLPFPWPSSLTIWFETPFGRSPCAITPLERDGKLVPISVGRVIACISRDLYAPIQPTAPYAGHTLLPAVRHAMASRPYDPEPSHNKRIPRIVDLYPVPHGAPLFFWGIELQYWGGLVARFGYTARNVV